MSVVDADPSSPKDGNNTNDSADKTYGKFDQPMNTSQNTKAIHWGINFGHLMPNINTNNVKVRVQSLPKPTKTQTSQKNRFYATKKKRIEIKTQIAVMLDAQMNTHQMYKALLDKGLLTDHKKAICKFTGFESMVSEVRKEINPDKKMQKQAIAELFDEGKTREQIQEILNATRPQVYQALVKTGRITPTKHSIKDK